jgi:O-antigen/teichoic acid export membrane protein
VDVVLPSWIQLRLDRVRRRLDGLFGVGVWVTVIHFASSGLLFASGVVVSRLGPESFGIYAAITRLLHVFASLPNTLQTTTNASVAGLCVSGSRREIRSFLHKRLGLSLAIMVPLGLALLAFGSVLQNILSLPQWTYVALLAAALPVDGLFAVTQGALQGYEMQRTSSLIFLCWQLARFGVTLLAVHSLQSLLAVAAAIPLSKLLAFLPSLVLALWIGTCRRERRPAAEEQVGDQQPASSFALHTFVSIALLQIGGAIPVVIARARMAALDSGVYAVAASLSNIMLTLAIALTVIVFPRVVRNWTKGVDSTRLVDGTSGIMLGTGLLATFAAHWIAPHLIRWLYTDSYSEAAGLLAGYVLAITLRGAGLLWTYFHIAIRSRTFVWVLGGVVVAETVSLLLCPAQALPFIITVGLSGLLPLITGRWLFPRAYRRPGPAVPPPGTAPP